MTTTTRTTMDESREILAEEFERLGCSMKAARVRNQFTGDLDVIAALAAMSRLTLSADVATPPAEFRDAVLQEARYAIAPRAIEPNKDVFLALTSACETIKALMTNPDTAAVQELIAANIIGDQNDKTHGPNCSCHICIGIRRANAEGPTTHAGEGMVEAAFRKWWREECRFGMTESEAVASFTAALLSDHSLTEADNG